jgi:glucose-1-phosphate cytidylyltransferase
MVKSNATESIADDSLVWEFKPMQSLAWDNILLALRHHEFWHPMNTSGGNNVLEKPRQSDNTRWKVW